MPSSVYAPEKNCTVFAVSIDVTDKRNQQQYRHAWFRRAMLFLTKSPSQPSGPVFCPTGVVALERVQAIWHL